MVRRPVLSLLLISALAALPAMTAPLAAQQATGPRIVSSQQLSPTERMITVQAVPVRRAQAKLLAKPPAEPRKHRLDGEEEEEERHRQPPILDDGLIIPPGVVAETNGGVPQKAAGTMVILRDSTLTGMPSGYSSRVDEPNVGSQGNGIFTTHNWYAEISTNNGTSYSYISPYTLFPNTPSDFSAGFCCDQRVAQDSSRDLVFWLLQYVQNGTTATSTNGDRLAVAHGQADLATNTWDYYDLTPGMFGLTGKNFDFPQLQVSANFLYFTTNIYTSSNDAFYGALVARIPLQELADGGPIDFKTYLTTSLGSITPVNGAQAEGTRPGRTTMYFGAVFSTTSLQVLTWPESATSPTATSVTGLSSISTSSYACTGPDGRNPCTRADERMQTGWITNTELGFMFASAQNGAARPYPYTRVVILDPATLAVLSQPDIFSTTSAWLYPAVAVNERGHLGGTIDNLGGGVFPTIRAFLRDDLSPNVTTSGWETFSVATSTAGTAGVWGDYNGAMAHEKYPKTWLAVGHVQNGGPNDINSRPHNYWFGRERDTNPAVTVTRAGTGTGTVTSSPAGINCGATCSSLFALGSTVTLTATPGAFSTFTGWSGACSGTGSCIVAIDDVKAVTANFTVQTFNLGVSRNGTGLGTVTSSPAGIDCGVTCNASFNGGTVVTLTPAPGALSTFTGWSGACSGTGSCMVTMDAAKSVTATFDLQTFNLTVLKSGPGTGSVTSSPAGIDCGATCAFLFTAGTGVTLTATPDAGSTFFGWSGDCTGTGSCAVTMDAARSVTATFTIAGTDFYTLAPCRVFDTRTGNVPLLSGVPRIFQVTGLCGIPSDAVAVSLNITAVSPTSTGHITLFPGDGVVPATSTLNFNTGTTRANNAILVLSADHLGTLGARAILLSGQVHLIVDVNGYFK